MLAGRALFLIWKWYEIARNSFYLNFLPLFCTSIEELGVSICNLSTLCIFKSTCLTSLSVTQTESVERFDDSEIKMRKDVCVFWIISRRYPEICVEKQTRHSL